jgi:calcium-dependent protein kinase
MLEGNFLILLIKSLYYMSPELIKGLYTQKCDIWSLGVVMFAMLTGCFPFKGEDKDKTFVKILRI